MVLYFMSKNEIKNYKNYKKLKNIFKIEKSFLGYRVYETKKDYLEEQMKLRELIGLKSHLSTQLDHLSIDKMLDNNKKGIITKEQVLKLEEDMFKLEEDLIMLNSEDYE